MCEIVRLVEVELGPQRTCQWYGFFGDQVRIHVGIDVVAGANDIWEIQHRVSQGGIQPIGHSEPQRESQFGDHHEFIAAVRADVAALGQQAAGEAFGDPEFRQITGSRNLDRLFVAAHRDTHQSFAPNVAVMDTPDESQLNPVKLVAGFERFVQRDGSRRCGDQRIQIFFEANRIIQLQAPISDDPVHPIAGAASAQTVAPGTDSATGAERKRAQLAVGGDSQLSFDQIGKGDQLGGFAVIGGVKERAGQDGRSAGGPREAVALFGQVKVFPLDSQIGRRSPPHAASQTKAALGVVVDLASAEQNGRVGKAQNAGFVLRCPGAAGGRQGGGVHAFGTPIQVFRAEPQPIGKASGQVVSHGDQHSVGDPVGKGTHRRCDVVCRDDHRIGVQLGRRRKSTRRIRRRDRAVPGLGRQHRIQAAPNQTCGGGASHRIAGSAKGQNRKKCGKRVFPLKFNLGSTEESPIRAVQVKSDAISTPKTLPCRGKMVIVEEGSRWRFEAHDFLCDAAF